MSESGFEAARLTEHDGRSELRRFLKAARARLSPRDVGVESVGRRGCPGLRREELAALAGLSEKWYTLFETGRCKVSIGALNRIATVLRLASHERSDLFRLAVPEFSSQPQELVATAPVPQPFADGTTAAAIVTTLREQRSLVRRLASASAPEEAGSASLEWLVTKEKPDVVGWFSSINASEKSMRYLAFEGPDQERHRELFMRRADPMRPCNAALYRHQPQTVAVNDMLAAGEHERRVAYERRARCWIAGRSGSYVLGYARRTPQASSRLEIEQMNFICSLLALTLA